MNRHRTKDIIREKINLMIVKEIIKKMIKIKKISMDLESKKILLTIILMKHKTIKIISFLQINNLIPQKMIIFHLKLKKRLLQINLILKKFSLQKLSCKIQAFNQNLIMKKHIKKTNPQTLLPKICKAIIQKTQIIKNQQIKLKRRRMKEKKSNQFFKL